MDQRVRGSWKRKLLWGAVTVCTISASAAWIVAIHQSSVGERRMTELLQGSTGVRFTAIDIEYQQRKVHCTDSDILDFIADAIRHHATSEISGGATYQVTFLFLGGGKFTTCSEIDANSFSVSMPSVALEEGFPTHYVHLQPPLPSKVAELFDFLGKPYQQVAGSVLILEGGRPPRVEKDSSLIAK